MSPLDQSTPKSYCRKSSSQSNKDVERHVKLRREEMDHQNNSSSKRNETAAMNLISKDDSALHSLSFIDTPSSTNRETAQQEREQAKIPNSISLFKPVVKKDQQEGGEQQLFAMTLSKEVREKDETRLKYRINAQIFRKAKAIKTQLFWVSKVATRLTHESIKNKGK